VLFAMAFLVYWLASSLGFVKIEGEFPNQRPAAGYDRRMMYEEF